VRRQGIGDVGVKGVDEFIRETMEEMIERRG
jgi:hypothetical protein